MPTEEELNAALNTDDGNIPDKDESAEQQGEQAVPAEEEQEEQQEEQTEEAGAEEKPQKAASRRDHRIQSLLEQRARADAEAQLQREIAERYRLQAEQAAQAQRRDEEAMLDPGEIRLRNAERMGQQAHMAALDAADKASFIAQAAIDPARARYRDRVETELMRARNAGQMASREGIYTFLRGQDAIAAEGKTAAARQKAADAVRRERGRPNTPTSNAAPNRTKSLEERLKDIPI